MSVLRRRHPPRWNAQIYGGKIFRFRVSCKTEPIRLGRFSVEKVVGSLTKKTETCRISAECGYFSCLFMGEREKAA